MELKLHCLSNSSAASPAAKIQTSSSNPIGIKLKYRIAGKPLHINKILIVDDNSGILRTYYLVLKRLGMEVFIVDPGKPIKEQVIELTSQHDFEAILMDGKMPDTSGSELITNLQTRQFKGYIFANSNSDPEQESMKKAGADYILSRKDIIALAEFIDLPL